MSTAPDYVGFESRGRDELLSQIGGFSPGERELFQRLCDSWAPEIEAQRIIKAGEASPEQETAALERLMSKLRTAQIGFLTHSEGATPETVVLTSPGSLVFWTHIVGEAIGRLVAKGFQILPSEERLKKAKALPPDYHIFDADSSILVEAHKGSIAEPTIYRFRLLNEYRILFTNSTARPLVNRAIGVLRRDIIERGIVDELARVLDVSIGEVTKSLDSKAPDVWLRLSRTLVQERATIAWRKSFEETDELFQLGYFVMTYVDAKMGAAVAQKENEAVVDEELEVLAQAVLESSGGIMSDQQFSSLVDDSQGRLKEHAVLLSNKIASDLLTAPPRKTLPRIVYLAQQYIHSARVRSVFEGLRRETGRRLSNEYTDIMEAYLRGRTAEIGEVFSSQNLLNEDIASRIKRGDALLSSLLHHPQLLAEATVLDARTKRETITREEIKGVLATYFDVESSQLLPLATLLGIDVVAIFDEAYANTSVFRQIFLRISGRHESLRGNYVRRFGPRRDARLRYDGESSPPRGGRSRTGGRDEQAGTRTRGTGNRGHSAETVKREQNRRPPAPPKPRVKSPQEIDKSWDEFSDALNARPANGDPDQ